MFVVFFVLSSILVIGVSCFCAIFVSAFNSAIRQCENAMRLPDGARFDSDEDAALRRLLSAVSIGAMEVVGCHVWYFDPRSKSFIPVADEKARLTLRRYAKAFGGSVRVARYDRDLEDFVRETITAETPLEEIVV